MLEMKRECLKCACSLELDSKAEICSFECTYCEACAKKLGHICDNCGGDLAPRPKRKTA